MQRLIGSIAGAAVVALVAGLAWQGHDISKQNTQARAEPAAPLAQPSAPEPTALSQAEEAEAAMAGVHTPIDDVHPDKLLFDITGEPSGPELMQGRGSLPTGWKPDPPLDLTGEVNVEKARTAIIKGVEYLLELQNENGSWDVKLEGTLLSDTADDAVDAIAATSLAGIALRYHLKVDPERLKPALKRAADFVMDRVYRGKLPIKVQYANWRYTLGMKFLHMEFMALGEETANTVTPPSEERRAEIEARKEEMRAVTRRMVQSMLKMQLSNDPAPLLERKRKARRSAGTKVAMPAQLGVVLDLPTDQSYRGGARINRIVPGSAAEKALLQVDDKIVGAEGVRVENAVDYYTLEPEWVGGQKVQIKIARKDAKDFVKDITLVQTWPGYVGLRVGAGIGTGPTIEDFLRFSPCKSELEVGDVLQKVNRQPVTTRAEYLKVEEAIKPGDKVTFEVLRAGKKKTGSVKADAAPEGWYGFQVEVEDKGDESGIVVGAIIEGGTAQNVDLAKGDRVTWIGDTPILGLDQVIDFAGTVPAGRTTMLKWTRNGEEMSGEVTADAILTPGDPQFDWVVNEGAFSDPIVDKVKPGGVAEKAGIRKGDRISAVNGSPIQILIQALWILWQIPAGDDVTFKVTRSSKDIDIKLTLAKQPPPTAEDNDTEEGGWAYYPERKDSPSFSTACALLAMYAVRDDMLPGLKPAMKGSLRSAEKLVASMRIKDAGNKNIECYVYAADSKTYPGGADVRGTQGRNAICELALFKAKKRNKGDLKAACDVWVRYRGELDAHRRLELYQNGNRGGSPHNYDRFFNAAYYFSFGHYYVLQAAKEHSPKLHKEIGDLCTKALLKTRLEDGTWLDHPAFGKLVGTGMALWILGETDGAWRDGYSPTTQDKMDEGAKPEEKPKEGSEG